MKTIKQGPILLVDNAKVAHFSSRKTKEKLYKSEWSTQYPRGGKQPYSYTKQCLRTIDNTSLPQDPRPPGLFLLLYAFVASL